MSNSDQSQVPLQNVPDKNSRFYGRSLRNHGNLLKTGVTSVVISVTLVVCVPHFRGLFVIKISPSGLEVNIDRR
jgi:hypothetical protein